MGDEFNSRVMDRIEKIESILEVAVSVQERFAENLRQLLHAQILMTDEVTKLADSVQKLAEAQRRTETRLNTLIKIVEGIAGRARRDSSLPPLVQ
jgi:predicted transcriptional regulator